MFIGDLVKQKIKVYIDRQIGLKFINSSKRVGSWEDAITIAHQDHSYDNLGVVSQYTSGENFIAPESIKLERSLADYVNDDQYPLPSTQDREGYMDSRHYEFWLSGLRDYLEIKHLLKKDGKVMSDDFKTFDLGCASGRVLRHFLCHEKNVELWATDINSRHVEWIRRFLGSSIKVFLNSKLPHLPLEDNFFDLVYAFSVFTHIDTFELPWLAELRRVLKRGGFVYITIHSENTWNSMKPGWPIYDVLASHPEVTPDILTRPMGRERIVYRWYTGASYAANVFHSIDYIRATWSRFFEIVDVIRQGHILQDVILLRKRIE